MLIRVGRSNFEREVLHTSGVVLVNFWSDWNESCRHMRRLLNEVNHGAGKDLRIVEINVDVEKELGRKYDVYGVPTLLVFQNGQLIARFSGTLHIEELINQIGLKLTSRWQRKRRRPAVSAAAIGGRTRASKASAKLGRSSHAGRKPAR